ncbi:MAG: class B sortase [Neobacillus sp.]
MLVNFKSIKSFCKKAVNSRITTVLFAVVFLFSGFMMFRYWLDSVENKKTYASLQETFYQDSEDKADKVTPETVARQKEKEILPKFQNLLSINQDTVGWLRVANTVIDYPVVQASDNQYYLYYTFDRKQNMGGSIFMDFRNSAKSLDQNTIIYGHQMKNGTMFSNLNKYRDKQFLKENRIIYFDSLYEEMRWEIFAVYVTDTDFNYIEPNFSDEKFNEFLQTVNEKSLFPMEMEITRKDKILTLSTCDFRVDDNRLVVHAKLIDDSTSEELDSNH